MSFFRRLSNRVSEIDSLLCVGLDPHVNELQNKTAEGAFTFCQEIISATSTVAAAYKPNAAFFEAFGSEGVAALKRVIEIIPDDIPILLDAKRGDISTTAEAYAAAAFTELGADAITLSPYMGFDSIKPFLTEGHGCFVLCKTSNPTSNDFQTLPLARKRRKLFEEVAWLASKQWNSADNVGLVVGATDVHALAAVRKVAPSIWILAPGIGAQGGDLQQACFSGLTDEGTGLLIPISRGISKAQDRHAAAVAFRDSINEYREMKRLQKTSSPEDSPTFYPYQQQFIEFAVSQQVLKFGSFTLKSGRISPYFFNAGLFSSGEALLQLGRFYAEAIVQSGVEFDVLFGPAYKGIPLATAVSMCLASDYDLCKGFAYNRKEAKDHGEGGNLVGTSMTGKKVLLIDDVITAGTAIREAMGFLEQAGAIPVGIVVALDRQEKTNETSTLSAVQEVETAFNIPVISVISLSHLATYLQNNSDASTLEEIKKYRDLYGIS